MAALDAHVDWIKRGAADANLSASKDKAPALAVWDESNAGDEIKDEKK